MIDQKPPFELHPLLSRYFDETPFLSLSEPSLIFDVGANIGQSVNAFSRIFPNSQFICFEPSPFCYDNLNSNLLDWSLSSRVKTEQLAISNYIGEAQFLNFLDNTTLSTLNPTSLNSPAEVLLQSKLHSGVTLRNNDVLTSNTIVNTTTLDHYCSLHGYKPYIIKIDVQGAELSVLEGGMSTLSCVNTVVIEISVDLSLYKVPITNLSDVTSLLESAGLVLCEIYNIHRNNQRPGINFIEAIYTRIE